MTFYSNKGARTIPWGKDSLSTNDVGKLDSHMQENEARPLSHTVYKVELKMDQRLQCRSQNCKTLKRKIGGNLCDLGVSSDSLDMIPKAEATKEKNR